MTKLRPGDTWTAKLPSHAGRDDAPTIRLRVLSVAEHMAMHDHLDTARAATNTRERYAAWAEAIGVGLDQFGEGEDWKAQLTPDEAAELLELILTGCQPEGDDLGNSDSPSATEPAASATTA